MPYIGQSYHHVVPVVDFDNIQNIPDFQSQTFTGPGTSFGLTNGAPQDVMSLDVSIDGVSQKPNVDYTTALNSGQVRIVLSEELSTEETLLVVYRALPGYSQTLKDNATNQKFLIDESTPTLGGDLNVNDKLIKSAENKNVQIKPGTGGILKLYDFTLTSSDGTNGQVLTTDGAGNITFQDAPGAVGGEPNTASNYGTQGVGIFKAKNLANLEFKRLVQGNGISLTDSGSYITVAYQDYSAFRRDYGLIGADYGLITQTATVQEDYGSITYSG
tara:strand:- start:1638 stop:2456 length:819 start_codon:yes stop_codon:yes gene_type:complete